MMKNVLRGKKIMTTSKIACLKCIHYYSTWDTSFPRGCKIYKIKSLSIPSNVVKSNSGEDCQAFSPRVPEKKKELDFNDPKLWD